MEFSDVITGYHTGELRVLRDVVNRGIRLTWSTQEREWLGHGIYFWTSLGHAERWRNIGYPLGWWDDEEPGILQADIKLGNCLNLTDTTSNPYVDEAAQSVKLLCDSWGKPLPENSRPIDGLPVELRLDCAIINQVHQNQHLAGESAFDTVIGAFPSGGQYLPGSMLRKDAHIQLAVRSYHCIENPRIVWPR